MASNPFHDLYLSEAIAEGDVVEFFSPIIVDHSGVVFEAGNVIIRGLQGTGKTMLLNLLRPELRLAYNRAGVDFPVPPRAAQFIGAGINLRKCGILEFAQLLEEDISPKALQELALLFADFFNYWIIYDLLASISVFRESGDSPLWKEIGLSPSAEKLDQFARTYSADECWFGALPEVSNFEALRVKIAERISIYRRYLNLNIDELPAQISNSKTLIGDPILKAVDALRASGLLDEKTKVFIRIDQYEQLTTLNIAGTEYGMACQQLIHKALGARDGRVSYRIGTRTHGWAERPAIYRTADVLERKRDFDVHDMDELFRRRENRATWRFPEFAQDIFVRRIRRSEYAGNPSALSMITALGRSLVSSARADSYAPSLDSKKKLIENAIASLPASTPSGWIEYIRDLGREDILAAWLSCAWVRQKVVPKNKVSPAHASPPNRGTYPWAEKPYWQKERVQLGMMQIASANRQAPMWSGENDVLSLSDGQILLFLFVVQHIWDAWLRDRRGERIEEFSFPIRQDVQSQGAREASNEWRAKQTEGPNAFKRRAFVDTLGGYLYVKLSGDKSMSNPGANGFSIENSELDSNVDVKDFLMDAVSYGDLVEAEHTSKKKGERRTKYYLTPILSPYFRIPSVHTKEPEYVTVEDVRRWLNGQGTLVSARRDALERDRDAMLNDLSALNIPRQQGFWDDEFK